MSFINEWRIWYISALLLFYIFFSERFVLLTSGNLIEVFSGIITQKWVAPSERWLGFLPFFLLATLSTASSDYIEYGIPRLCSYFILVWFIHSLFKNLFKQNKEILLQKIISGISILLLVGYLWQFFDSDFTHLESNSYNGITRPPRFHGLFGNPNSLAIFCMLFFIWCFSIWRIHPQIFPDVIWIILFVFLAFNMFLSKSRTEAIALLAFLYVWKFPRMSFVGVLVGLIGLFFFRSEIFGFAGRLSVFLGLTDWIRPETLRIGGGRFIAYEFGWSFIGEHPWFGNGWGYTNFLFSKYESYLTTQDHIGNAHQSFLTLWLDTGLSGLLLFILGWFFFLKSAFWKQRRLMTATIIAVLISVNFESWLIASLNPFTILLVLIVSTLADYDDAKSVSYYDGDM
ncbi:MAG: O-antigen ligase family protein [Saprospiraceae bacterium]|nr:O-antigen ligase family protein [Saprospiraceae bacterium]